MEILYAAGSYANNYVYPKYPKKKFLLYVVLNLLTSMAITS